MTELERFDSSLANVWTGPASHRLQIGPDLTHKFQSLHKTKAGAFIFLIFERGAARKGTTTET